MMLSLVTTDLAVGMIANYVILSLKLGNPVLDFATDYNSRAEFFWSHGVISDSTYNIFTTVCNYSRYVSEFYRDSISPLCSEVMTQVNKETSKFVDIYDVTLDVCVSSVFAQSKVITTQVLTMSLQSIQLFL